MGKHWVPRRLLRGFATDKAQEYVVQYEKGDVHPKKVPIAVAAQSKDAFSEEVESIMASVEGMANPFLDCLRQTGRPLCIDDAVKRLFSIYLYMFVWRRDMAHMDDMLRKQAKRGKQDIARELQDIAGRHGGATRQTIIDKTQELAQKFDQNPKRILDDIWDSGNVIRFMLYNMTWTILQTRNEASQFVAHSRMLLLCPVAKRDGIASKNAMLFIPISSSRGLLLSWRDQSDKIRIFTASPEMVEFFNLMGVAESRFAYARSNEPHLSRMMQGCLQPDLDAKFDACVAVAFRDWNEFSSQLGAFKNWQSIPDGVRDGFEKAENAICMAPNAPSKEVHAGLEVSVHDWSGSPISVPIARDVPNEQWALEQCLHCGHARKTDSYGNIHYENHERLLLNCKDAGNWWDNYEWSRL